MAEADKAVKIVVALLIGGLLAAFLLPIAIDPMVGDESQTLTQDTGDTDTLQADLNVTLDSTDTTGDNATYTVSTDAASTSATVDNGTSTTVTVDGTDVTISPEDINSGSATTQYEYPTTYGWTGGAGSMWLVLPLLLVLAIFLFFTKVALDRF